MPLIRFFDKTLFSQIREVLKEIVVREAGCLSPNIGAGLRLPVIEKIFKNLESNLNRALSNPSHMMHQW
jgi:hypothetical protein